MRAMVYVMLVSLALVSALSGSWRLALVAASIKTLLVASEYMELRRAHRAHGVAFALGACVLTAALAVLATPR
ncbi:MAG: hypothetical protein U0326_08175 [Polyangiales bacterium]